PVAAVRRLPPPPRGPAPRAGHRRGKVAAGRGPRFAPPGAGGPAGWPGGAPGGARPPGPATRGWAWRPGGPPGGRGSAGLPGLSLALLWLAAACYAVLVVLYAWRLVSYRADVGRDLRDPAHSFGFFTIVAGTGVLGTRLAADGQNLAAFALLAAAGAVWLVLVYLIPWLAVRHGPGQAVAEVNGTWFIWAVATQSVAALSA